MPTKQTLLIACSLALICGSCKTTTPTPISSTIQPPATNPTTDIRYRTSDCHLHLVDFLQRTDGIEAALAAMDRTGVDEAVIHGMPLVKSWPQAERLRPEYYLDDDSHCYWYSATDVLVARAVQSLPPDKRHRFHPTICGFNGADRNALDHIKRMIDWYPDFWEGIGEVMTRHDDLTALTYGDPARADNLALGRIFDFAAKHDLPVFLHSNIGSVWKREPIYLPEVETAAKAHPKTRIIWCHAGISRRIVIPTLVQDINNVLEKYPNLWVDISWEVYKSNLLTTKPGTTELVPSESWVKLIEKFPNRFMIGSDKVGHFSDYSPEILKYYVFLDALRPETARKLARENMLSVLPKHPARLTEEEAASLNGYSGTAKELLK